MTAIGSRRPRIAVLWTGLSGYMHASLRALDAAGAELLVAHRQLAANAPFDPSAITDGLVTHAWSGAPDVEAIGQMLDDMQPDGLLVCSWSVGGYRKLARAWRGRTVRIVGMDNQWWGTPKQWAGVASSRLVIQPAYDAALIGDERGAVFASKLGFPARRLIWGVYTCDHDLFADVARRRGDGLPPRAFAYVGRLVPDKAIDVLAEGYRRYRATATDPWPLVVAGTGPDAHLLDGQPGVERIGFVQPGDLPRLFERVGCLVLPSRFEPWGVVVHEATAAGLPVVCTRVCGASTRLVLDGYNGVVVGSDDAAALASGFERLHGATDDERRAFGVASTGLARQYTPERWAAQLLDRIPDLRAEVGLPAAPWRGADAGTPAAVAPGG